MNVSYVSLWRWYNRAYEQISKEENLTQDKGYWIYVNKSSVFEPITGRVIKE
jgi:hypothetical protein